MPSLRRAGAQVAGYTLEEEIGGGGFGTVYRVTREGLPPRALKILHAELLAVPVMVKRFEREVATIRALNHEGCVKVYESGTLDDNSPYFAMELLEGEDLGERLHREGRLSHGEVLETLRPVCSLLQAAHARGVVHRDIKASNIFLTRDRRVVVLDFGIAKVLDVPGMSLTLTRQVIGTPCAMSPEQLGGQRVDARTDVYGLGALAFHMLTGQVPFASGSATLMQELHRHAARVVPSSLAPVSDAIDRVIVRAMAIEAADRHPSSESFFRELEASISGRSEPSRRRAQALVAHVVLGPAGDDVERAEARGAMGELAVRVLTEGGFQVVGRSARGAVCALVLSGDPAAAELERSAGEAVAARALTALPPGVVECQLRTGCGEVQVQGHAVVGGAVLVPPGDEGS